MAGMKFLNLKGWHPSNARNQKRIWIAEQKAKATEQAEREAAAEVRKHAETVRFQALARGESEIEKLQVGFLYAPPPGLEKVDEKTAQEMTEDDAVREFRRKMEKRTAPAQGDEAQKPLERYVGRRPDEMLTIKEQVERFPFLKDAPVEGDYASNVKVNFKPMGRTLRNVKCMRCGEWGHQSGDRECALRDANPHDAARQAMEDPLALMMKLKKDGQLVLKQSALPLEMQSMDGRAAADKYEILLSDEESMDPEKAYLAGLSTKEKKSLLKKLRKQTKQHKRRAREKGDDSSDGSTESNEDTHKRRRRRKTHCKESKREEDTSEPSEFRRRGDHARESPRRRGQRLGDRNAELETDERRARPPHGARSRSRSRGRNSHRRDRRDERRRSYSPDRERRRHRHRSPTERRERA